MSIYHFLNFFFFKMSENFTHACDVFWSNPYPIPLASHFFPISPTLPILASCTLSWSPLSPLKCCQHVSGDRNMYWSMGSLSASTSEENWLPLLQQPLAANSSSARFGTSWARSLKMLKGHFLTGLYTLHIVGATTWIIFLNSKGPTFAQYPPPSSFLLFSFQTTSWNSF